MPLYEYQCRNCSRQTEALQSFSDPSLETCDDCGGELEKLISAPAIQFKDSGWYVTDYAGKGEGQDGPKKQDGDAGGKSKEGGDKKDSGGAKSDSKSSSESKKSTSKKDSA